MDRRIHIDGVRKIALGVTAALLFLLLFVPATAHAANDTYTVKVNSGYLALRTAPSYDSGNEVGQLYTGDTVVVRNRNNGQYWWVYSPKYGREGYVNKSYLMPPSSPSSYGDYRVKVDKNYLALRTAPAYKRSNEIGELYTGDTVTVYDKSNGKYWWVYSPKYNCRGYVNKNYLVPSYVPSNYGDYTVKVNKGYLALRTAPAYEASNEVGQLYTGDTVTVYDKDNGQYWWVYSPKYDRKGYVNKNYLR